MICTDNKGNNKNTARFKSKKFAKFVVLSKYLLLFICFFVGCRAIPTWTEINNTLLVGKIVFEGSDFVDRNGISFHGTTTSGIEIALRNTATNEVFRLLPAKNGLFYVNLREGKYMVDELYIKKTRQDGAWAYIYTRPAHVFEVEKGKVNNIGRIGWTFLGRRHEVVQMDESLNVQNEFSTQFPTSNWNQKEWKYEKWTFETVVTRMPSYSDEHIFYYVKSEDGMDSLLVSTPKDMPVEARRNFEIEMIRRINVHRAQGDTTYYVKSEDGLDSALLTIPKYLPEAARKVIEDRTRQSIRILRP